MPRSLDDRPFANDPGMADQVYPSMGLFGRALRHGILRPQVMEHRTSPDNGTITIESPLDFVKLAKLFGSLVGRNTVDFSIGEDDMSFTPDAEMVRMFFERMNVDDDGSTPVRLRLAGESAAVLLGHLAVADPGHARFDLRQNLDGQTILRELAALDFDH